MWAQSVDAMPSHRTTCLIVDDSTDFSRLASAALERDGLEVVGTASSAAEAVARAAELRPEIALVDIDLGADSGFDVALDLASAETVVILISAHAEADLAALVEASPALGFIPKLELSTCAVLDMVDANGSSHTDG
jgi:ActR/RegA family two-component response regulator